ncbi:MAG: phenylacetic acid degradation operon negative regulatory protein PaaX [Gammaproteobacteria bacterium]|nr:phenylacetic acid degradation operon negative regulatory protein PaaX [Gammaproteobacteria bacterium]NNF61327.1 phenylacetic acid degradation operon negative regulatory protein PaaX [Gammaproteobacteria bacterium]NNM20760.1 phenylacetic acid degradation operon negative regulatory protein PaaX [Gammaproteobacteria bacterium]
MATSAARRNGANSFTQATAGLISAFGEQRPIRAGSLLITVFGDSIAPHGGTVWLGALIRALEGFGINQRLVRTSVFRLVRDGWLSTEQLGRRSYYSLTDDGRQRFADASRRIYSAPLTDWSGQWTFVLLSGLDATSREDARKSLRWLGFAPFSANLMAHPAPDADAVDSQLGKSREQAVVMQTTIDMARERGFAPLLQAAWQLDQLGERYRALLEQFRPVYQSARRRRQLDPERAFQVRTLLVHEYRKILLRDPQLPEALLPAQWPGLAAYQLCRNLYRLVAPATETYLVENMETADGPLPPAEPQYLQRFGGLDNTRGTRR